MAVAFSDWNGLDILGVLESQVERAGICGCEAGGRVVGWRKRLLGVRVVSRFVLGFSECLLFSDRERVLFVLVSVRWSSWSSSQENRRLMMVLQRRLFGADRCPGNFA